MVSRSSTFAFSGLSAVAVEVQAHIAPGMHAFVVVGLPDKVIAESRERIRAAFHAVGLSLPYQRITLSLSPADLPKEGSHYDLPMALALLAAMEIVHGHVIERYASMGELALDGGCRAVSGCLPAALALTTFVQGQKGPASADIQPLIIAARAQQRERQAGLNSVANVSMSDLAPPAAQLLSAIAHKNSLSARGFARVLRVARTLADMDARADISDEDIALALRWRQFPDSVQQA